MEYDQALAQFRLCDSEKAGTITPDEFFRFCRANSWVRSQDEARQLFRQVDRQGSGRITLDEFLKWKTSNGRHLAFSANSGSFEGPAAMPIAQATRPVPQVPRAGASGIIDPDLQKEAKIAQVTAFLPQLTHQQAADLLRRNDWDSQRAIEAGLQM